MNKDRTIRLIQLIVFTLSLTALIFSFYSMSTVLTLHRRKSKTFKDTSHISGSCGYKHEGAVYKVVRDDDKLIITNKETDKLLHECNDNSGIAFNKTIYYIEKPQDL